MFIIAKAGEQRRRHDIKLCCNAICIRIYLVIESLDNMKKSRESYAAREAIKFLEKELHSGSKFIQAQKVSESLNPGRKKPVKMEIQDW